MTAYTSPDPQPLRVTARRRPAGAAWYDRLFGQDLDADVMRAKLLAQWLDTKFEVAGVRLGFDAILGLVPGIGDTVATLFGLYPLLIARRHRLGRLAQVRMAGNLLFDWAIGLLPVLGDLADIGFKGHLRNYRILEREADKRMGRRSR